MRSRYRALTLRLCAGRRRCPRARAGTGSRSPAGPPPGAAARRGAAVPAAGAEYAAPARGRRPPRDIGPGRPAGRPPGAPALAAERREGAAERQTVVVQGPFPVVQHVGQQGDAVGDVGRQLRGLGLQAADPVLAASPSRGARRGDRRCARPRGRRCDRRCARPCDRRCDRCARRARSACGPRPSRTARDLPSEPSSPRHARPLPPAPEFPRLGNVPAPFSHRTLTRCGRFATPGVRRPVLPDPRRRVRNRPEGFTYRGR